MHHRQPLRPETEGEDTDVPLQDHPRARQIQNYASIRRSISPPSPTNRKQIAYHHQGVHHSERSITRQRNQCSWLADHQNSSCMRWRMPLTPSQTDFLQPRICYRRSFTSTGRWEKRYTPSMAGHSRNKKCLYRSRQSRHVHSYWKDSTQLTKAQQHAGERSRKVLLARTRCCNPTLQSPVPPMQRTGPIPTKGAYDRTNASGDAVWTGRRWLMRDCRIQLPHIRRCLLRLIWSCQSHQQKLQRNLQDNVNVLRNIWHATRDRVRRRASRGTRERRPPRPLSLKPFGQSHNGLEKKLREI